MISSSQAINSVKETATHAIQDYLQLQINLRCSSQADWTREVSRIRKVAVEGMKKFPKFESSYKAVVDKIDRNTPEQTTIKSWDLTALRTIVSYIHPLGIWLPDEMYKVFLEIVEDKNFQSHENTNESWDIVRIWSGEALNRVEMFIRLACSDAAIPAEEIDYFTQVHLACIAEVQSKIREGYDERYRFIETKKREAILDAENVAHSARQLEAYGQSFPRWMNCIPDSYAESFEVWRVYNETLGKFGMDIGYATLGDDYYFGSSARSRYIRHPGAPHDNEIAAHYYSACEDSYLHWDQKMRLAGLHLFGLIENASTIEGNRLLKMADRSAPVLNLAREYFSGKWVPCNWDKAAELYAIAPTSNTDRLSNRMIMTPQDYANLASIYMSRASSDDRECGNRILSDLKGALSEGYKVSAVLDENGIKRYLIVRAD